MKTRISLRFTAELSEDLIAAITAFENILKPLGVEGIETHVGGCPECGGATNPTGTPGWQNRSTCQACGHHFSV